MSTTTLTQPGAPTGAVAAPPRRSVVRDTLIVLVRELGPTVNDPFSVVFSLVQPIIFLALFGPLLAANLGDGLPGGAVWAWFVPAILVMISLFGSSTVGPTCSTRCRPARTSGCSSPRWRAPRCWSGGR